MAVGIPTTGSGAAVDFKRRPFLAPKSASVPTSFMVSPFLPDCRGALRFGVRRRPSLTVCFGLEDEKFTRLEEGNIEVSTGMEISTMTTAGAGEKVERKKSKRSTYLVAAVMSSFGITSMAVMAVYYRFAWKMEGGVYAEMFGTFALSVGSVVGMEFWARWAHKALWHASLWHVHESHHKPREGTFELNDVFAIINAVPTIALLSYGFLHKGLIPGLCFGAVFSDTEALPSESTKQIRCQWARYFFEIKNRLLN